MTTTTITLPYTQLRKLIDTDSAHISYRTSGGNVVDLLGCQKVPPGLMHCVLNTVVPEATLLADYPNAVKVDLIRPGISKYHYAAPVGASGTIITSAPAKVLKVIYSSRPSAGEITLRDGTLITDSIVMHAYQAKDSTQTYSVNAEVSALFLQTTAAAWVMITWEE